MKIIGAAVLATALLTAGASSAQSRIEPGQSINGTLSKSDPTLGDDSHFDCHVLQTQAGQAYRVELRSRAFDAYLAVGPGTDCLNLQDPESDDDSAGDTDARVEFTGDGGVWALRANSLSAGRTGDYTLAVSASTAASQSMGGGAGDVAALLMGRTRSGDLTAGDQTADDNSYFDCFVFTGAAGHQVTLEIRSPAFDAYLALYSGGTCSGDYIGSDDDGGGGTDSRLTTTLPADGVYSVRANSLSAGSTGAYSITLSD